MKLKERFILTSKEDMQKHARLRRALTLTVFISAVIVPLINEGVLYTVITFTENDIALLTFNYILRYIVVFLRYLCVFVSFAAVITGIFHYGYKTFKTPSVILLCGGAAKYLIGQFGSWVFCFEHGLVDVSVTDAAAMGFEYFFLAVFDLIKNVALIIICCRFAEKARDSGLLFDSDSKPEKIRFSKLLGTSLKRSDPFFGFCLFAAGVQTVFEMLSIFASVTLFQLITDGLPETGADYATLLSGYVLIIPLCAVGFVICTVLCTLFSYMKPAKKQ